MRDFKFSTREISSFHYERFRLSNPRDFDFAIKADFISVCHDMGDCIQAVFLHSIYYICKNKNNFTSPIEFFCNFSTKFSI